MTDPADSILIRHCRGMDELDACVQLQAEVWSYAAADAVPRRVFVLAPLLGGQVVGAFDTSDPRAGCAGNADSLIGFAMALPAIRHLHPYLHSHMLAVQPQYRDRGIGRRLKFFQREDSLARGITRMEWTFDPLEIKNSFLNIARLGVIARRYTPNLYGVSSSSLHGPLPTDRLHAEWWMDSERVHAALRGDNLAPPPVERTIQVPREIGHWKRSRAERAKEIQGENRERFLEAFAHGLAVVGFAVEDGNGVFQLGRWQEPPSSSPYGTVSP